MSSEQASKKPNLILRLFLTVLGGAVTAMISFVIVSALTSTSGATWPFIFVLTSVAGVCEGIWNSSWLSGNSPKAASKGLPADAISSPTGVTLEVRPAAPIDRVQTDAPDGSSQTLASRATATPGRLLYLGLQWLLAAFLLFIVVAHLSEVPASLATLTGLVAAAFCAPPVRRVIAKRVRFFPRLVVLPLTGGLIFATFSILLADWDTLAKQAGFSSYSDLGRARRNGLADTAALAAFDAKVAADQQALRLAEETRKQQVEDAERRKEADCAVDLQCLASRHTVSSALACKTAVERLAKYDVKWTDALIDMKFPKLRWRDRSRGQITFIGDRIKFQNGFGAWETYTYFCDFDTRTNTVLNVEAEPGRLPE